MVRELTKQFTNFGYTTTGKQEPENVHTVKIRIANVQLQNISGFILDTLKGENEIQNIYPVKDPLMFELSKLCLENMMCGFEVVIFSHSDCTYGGGRQGVNRHQVSCRL